MQVQQQQMHEMPIDVIVLDSNITQGHQALSAPQRGAEGGGSGVDPKRHQPDACGALTKLV